MTLAGVVTDELTPLLVLGVGATGAMGRVGGGDGTRADIATPSCDGGDEDAVDDAITSVLRDARGDDDGMTRALPPRGDVRATDGDAAKATAAADDAEATADGGDDTKRR